jgi:hypothetical protein
VAISLSKPFDGQLVVELIRRRCVHPRRGSVIVTKPWPPSANSGHAAGFVVPKVMVDKLDIEG